MRQARCGSSSARCRPAPRRRAAALRSRARPTQAPETAFTLSSSEVFTTRDSPSFSLTFRHLHAARFSRLPRPRSLQVLCRAARSASARQRRASGPAGAQLDRTDRRLEGRPAPADPNVRPRSGEPRVSQRTARVDRQAGDRPARRAERDVVRARAAAQPGSARDRRGASCCRIAATRNTVACRSRSSSSRASTSSRPSPTCCAPTPSSSCRTSGWSRRPRPGSC